MGEPNLVVNPDPVDTDETGDGWGEVGHDGHDPHGGGIGSSDRHLLLRSVCKSRIWTEQVGTNEELL